MKKLLLISLLLSASYHYGQVGIGTPAPEPGAQLDIVAADRGLLIPRVALVDPALRNPIADMPGESLLVYNTATTAELRPGFYYWRNRWLRIQDQNDGAGGSETLTSLNDNGDGTLTYTDELGNATVITLDADETLTSLMDNGDRTLTYTDENGHANTIDIGAMETLTLLSQDTATGTISYTKENGLVATAQVVSADADNGLTTGSDGGAFLNTDALDKTDDAWTDNPTDSRIELGTLSDGTTVRTAENQMVVTDDGHLGVQTDTPVGPLDVTDSSTPWYLHKVVSNGRHIGHYRAPDGRFASALGISIPGAGSLTGANDALVFKRSGGGGGTDFNRQGVGISISQNNEFRNMGFYTSNGSSLEERMTLDENGQLGIGTAQPGSRLDIDGKVRVRDLSGTQDINDRIVVADATTGELKARTFGSLGTDGTDDAWVNNDAENRLELTTESDGSTARATGTEFVVEDSGEVGIGTPSPQAKLDVRDYAMIDGIDVGNGRNTTTGRDNVAVGNGALSLNTVGNNNTAIGASALENNSTGGGNTAIGFSALRDNTASANTAIGHFALVQNTSGNFNIAIGDRALPVNTTGSVNLAMGHQSLGDVTTGGRNIVLGTQSGRGITTGSQNVIIGHSVTGLPSDLSRNIILADGQGRQRIRVIANGDVGIGTDAPTHKLDVNGKVRVQDLSGTANPTDLLVVADATTGELKAQTLSNLGTDGTDDAWTNNDAANRIELATQSDGTTARPSETEVVVTDLGRVGIGLGSTNPITKLQVGDWARIDGVDIGRGRNGTDISNTAIGDGALAAVTGGRYNTAVGKGALRITESSGNTALGSFALFNSNSYSNTAIGGFSMQSATTGNSTVSIGYTTLRNFQTGSGNVAMGNGSLIDLTSGGFNTVLGHNSGRGIANGSNNTILGARVGGLPTNLSNNIIIADGAGNQRIRVLANGDMGVGTEAPTHKLDVDGKVRVRDLSGTTNSSDLMVVADATTGELKASTVAASGSDSSDDAFINNTIGNKVELNTLSDGSTTRTTGTEFVIEDSGNVGVGTANPTAKLHVTDYALIDGLTIGKGAGNADDSNTVVGLNAFTNSSTGERNTAFGKDALAVSNTASGNTAIGALALSSNLGGSFNTAIGSNSMEKLTTGFLNTSLGAFTLDDLTSGSFNVAIGISALNGVTTGSRNVGLGGNTMNQLTDGNRNVAIGYQTGAGLQTGSANTILGSGVSLPSNLSNNVIISDGDGNQRIRILANGDMGVGTETPTAKLEVNGTIKATDINFTGLPTYADEAAASAGGLAQGDMYQTGTGELRIKL